MKQLIAILSTAAFLFGANYNISVIKPKEGDAVTQKEFFAKTTYKEAATKDITLRFSGYVEKIYTNAIS